MRVTVCGARFGRLATKRGFFFVDLGGGAFGTTRAGTPPVRFFLVCFGIYSPISQSFMNGCPENTLSSMS